MDEQHIEAAAKLWPTGRLQAYSNMLAIRFELSGAELCFAQRGVETAGIVPRCWLITAPVHLLSFRSAIDQAVRDYEVQFGRLVAESEMPTQRGRK